MGGLLFFTAKAKGIGIDHGMWSSSPLEQTVPRHSLHYRILEPTGIMYILLFEREDYEGYETTQHLTMAFESGARMEGFLRRLNMN